jgi:hypothetical protein
MVANRNETQAEERDEDVVATDDEIFEEKEVAQQKQKFLGPREWRPPVDDEPDPDGQHRVQYLHRCRIGGKAGEQPNHAVPQAAAGLVLEMTEELPKRRVARR